MAPHTESRLEPEAGALEAEAERTVRLDLTEYQAQCVEQLLTDMAVGLQPSGEWGSLLARAVLPEVRRALGMPADGSRP